jgi:hypothetical protein
MEECDLIILIFACYTITKYEEQKIDKFVDTENVKYINLKGNGCERQIGSKIIAYHNTKLQIT